MHEFGSTVQVVRLDLGDDVPKCIENGPWILERNAAQQISRSSHRIVDISTASQ